MFHWICPECGREIPPSERACPACDPSAVAPSVVEPVESALLVETLPPPLPVEVPLVIESKPEPVGETLPLVEARPAPPKFEPVPTLEASPVAAEPPPLSAAVAEPVPEVVATTATVQPPVAVETKAETIPQIIEAAPAESDPVAAPVAVETKAEPVEETTPQIDAVPEPVRPPVPVEVPVLETAAEPVAALASETEPVVKQPAVEAATEPVATEALAPAREAEQIRAIEPAPVGTEPEPEPERFTQTAPVAIEPLAEAVPQVEPVPVAEQVPPAELTPGVALEHALPEATVPEPSPVVAAAPVEQPAAEVPIKLHEVPDPLFALAVEIRAVQAARAAAQAAPQESAGLLELAEAVGEPAPVEQAEPVEQAAPERAAPVEHAVPLAEPEKPHSVEAALAAVESPAAIALLAPPEPEKTLILEPVALAAAPQPVVEPESIPQPSALAPEPRVEPEGPTLPFAPMQDYTPATSRSILPVPPRVQILAGDSGPRITLPGPTLPPELTRLQDANVVTVIGEQTAQRTKEAIPPSKRAGAPGWLVSALVMVVLLAAGLAVVYFLLLPHAAADSKPAPTPAVAASTPAPTGGNSPLAKFVEVTGFRIITSSVDANKKAEVQYLVVNHSDADISDANVFITLRGAKPGQAPVCRFSFKIPSLGPFEAKEMSSPIEKSTRGASLPDWQDLRADVQISQ